MASILCSFGTPWFGKRWCLWNRLTKLDIIAKVLEHDINYKRYRLNSNRNNDKAKLKSIINEMDKLVNIIMELGRYKMQKLEKIIDNLYNYNNSVWLLFYIIDNL